MLLVLKVMKLLEGRLTTFVPHCRRYHFIFMSKTMFFTLVSNLAQLDNTVDVRNICCPLRRVPVDLNETFRRWATQVGTFVSRKDTNTKSMNENTVFLFFLPQWADTCPISKFDWIAILALHFGQRAASKVSHLLSLEMNICFIWKFLAYIWKYFWGSAQSK